MFNTHEWFIISVVMSIHALFAMINGGYGLDILAKTEVMKYNGTTIKSYDGHLYDKIGATFTVSLFMFLINMFFYIFTMCKICTCDVAINFPRVKSTIYKHLFVRGFFAALM